MRSTAVEKVEKEKRFEVGLYTAIPDRHKLTGLVVMMYSMIGTTYYGVVVNPGKSGYDIGHHMTCWDASSFKPFHGSVTIDTD